MIGRRVTSCAVLLLAGASPALATSLLTDSPALLADWNSPIGLVSVDANSVFLPASTAVTNRLALSTGNNDSPTLPLFAAVNAYIGTSVDIGEYPDYAGGPVEGSAINRSFTANPGDTVVLSYDFLTAEAAPLLAAALQGNPAALKNLVDDYAFVTLTHAGVTQLYRLADILTPGYDDADDLSDGRFTLHTGFRTFQFNLPTTGVGPQSYVLGLGVMDGGSALLGTGTIGDLRAHGGESLLLVESIDVESAAAVPAPAAAPAGLALLAVATLSRRRCRA